MTPDNNDSSDNTGEEAANDVTHDPAEAEKTTPADDDKIKEVADNPTNCTDAESEVLAQGAEQETDLDGEEPLDELTQLQQKLAEQEAVAADHWDRLLRLQAEMENQRKRAQNDVTKARKFALEGIVNDLLPVRDSLEMGLVAAQAEDADPKSIIEGADLTLKMLVQLFEKNNIEEVNPVDEKFDPEFHQAMSMQEVEGKAPNTVTSVMQKGYTLNERLVRPALVMVSK